MPGVSAATELRAAAAAFAFLSRFPFRQGFEAGPSDVARGAWAFPLAGAAIGAAAGLVIAGAGSLLTTPAAAALGVVAAVLLSGGLHLDGLADSADGLGGRTREEALRAMRDHAVGAYGATAIGLDLILRTALLAALLDDGAATVVAASIAAGAISRAAVLPLPLVLPYAQPVRGAGAALSAGGGWGRALAALAIALAISVASAGIAAIACLGVAAAVVILAGLHFRRRLGGITGDTLGAGVELVELACLATLVALA
jgi:adenosylcobinamide-GDP ribazoletransferase